MDWEAARRRGVVASCGGSRIVMLEEPPALSDIYPSLDEFIWAQASRIDAWLAPRFPEVLWDDDEPVGSTRFAFADCEAAWMLAVATIAAEDGWECDFDGWFLTRAG